MSGIKVGGEFIATLRDKWTGDVKWERRGKNVVVSTGLIHILNTVLCGGTQVGTWYIGLIGQGGTVTTGSKMSTHSFTESSRYAQATRVTFAETRTGVSVSNSAAKSTFTLNTDGTTIQGAFLTSTTTKKGTLGTLLCGAEFSGGDKVGDSGDKLEVTYTFTAADA